MHGCLKGNGPPYKTKGMPQSKSHEIQNKFNIQTIESWQSTQHQAKFTKFKVHSMFKVHIIFKSGISWPWEVQKSSIYQWPLKVQGSIPTCLSRYQTYTNLRSPVPLIYATSSPTQKHRWCCRGGELRHHKGGGMSGINTQPCPRLSLLSWIANLPLC